MVKAHAGTPKVTPHKVLLKNLASYTGPKHSSEKPAEHAHVKTDNFMLSYSNLQSQGSDMNRS